METVEGVRESGLMEGESDVDLLKRVRELDRVEGELGLVE